MPITADQLREIIIPVKYPEKQVQQITDALNKTFSWYKIDTPLRIAHFLAQVLHETSAFRYTSEIWGPTPAQKRYDTRVDLGNTPERDNDGYKYRGRGWIQLTGKTNYRTAGTAFGQDFLNKPEMVQEYPWAALVSGWFWHKRKLNALADADDFTGITKKINGGFNGLDDRFLWLQKVKKTLA